MIIRNIWCVGRNYAEHARELGNAVPGSPMIFLKAGSSASVNSTEIILPWWTQEIHHEVELALKFNQSLHFSEVAVALDLTERSLQAEAKKQGAPWTLSKSFDGACPVSPFLNFKDLNELQDVRLRLWVNEELRQDGRTSQMIFSLPILSNYIREHFPVCAGDLILSGTPAGVGPLRDQDVVKAQLEINAENRVTHQWRVRRQETPPDIQGQEPGKQR